LPGQRLGEGAGQILDPASVAAFGLSLSALAPDG